MDDGIIYHLEDSGQFWAELDEILTQGENNQDSALNSVNVFIKFVSDFQDNYLENETEFMHCCYKLLVSSIYQRFSDRIIEHVIQRASKKRDVKELCVLFNILFLAGRENKKIFKKMQERKFVSKLKGHIENKEDVRLQQISIKLLFEICLVQRLSADELNLIDELFLNQLLDLVEKTRDDEDETFNYSVIRLILSFNEQFMLAIMSQEVAGTIEIYNDWNSNTVLRVLGERIGSSKTFGENVIFMLNRAVDHHIQMLILKLLHEIFNTPETYEFFYTNDLRVLIDVFIRELYDLPEESEALRNTYLRVLYPLIENTQLCQNRYKQHQIYSLLLDLAGSSTKQFKPVSPTTQRLVDRCLMTEYLNDIAPSRNCGNEIKRVPTPNALVMGMDAARNKNSSNGNGFTVKVGK